RQARYAFFAAAARRRQCHLAATAHTSTAHAEPILMNLARGSGPQGLAGIPRVMRWGSLVVVRPLRDIERGALLRFLKQRRLTWREDLSNADASFLRNRVRHEVLPFLEQKLNPRIRPALIHMAAILEKENAWLDKLARDLFADLSSPAGLNTGRLSAQPQGARRRILRLWLMAQGFTAASLDFELVERLDGWLLSSARGRALTLPGGRLARQEGQELRLESSQPPAPFCIPLKIPGSTHLPQLGLRVSARVAPGTRRARPPGMGHYPVQASLALKAWRRRRVVVRSWQAGDRMAPLGLDGSKKVQDIFTDAKVPRAERQRLPLFVCGDEIIWIPGYRIARACATGTAQEQALQLTLKRVGRARPAAAQGCAARARCTARR
ncbi:MAG: tRNA lysidine(34) synthetase TilS, partial [Lentisphaerae bacterium]|nr:tRNA lysidine(34) synthetase TilS [Lentisphaerota bacterium]